MHNHSSDLPRYCDCQIRSSVWVACLTRYYTHIHTHAHTLREHALCGRVCDDATSRVQNFELHDSVAQLYFDFEIYSLFFFCTTNSIHVVDCTGRDVCTGASCSAAAPRRASDASAESVLVIWYVCAGSGGGEGIWVGNFRFTTCTRLIEESPARVALSSSARSR
jgi:hypothetical protein